MRGQVLQFYIYSTVVCFQPLPVPGSKKEKHLTKTALAKRALKKKLQMNTKVVFDEEGEVGDHCFTKLREQSVHLS